MNPVQARDRDIRTLRGLGLHVIAPPPAIPAAGVSGAYPPPPALLG